MGKAVLVIDMPESCDVCNLVEMVNGKLYCGVPGCGELAEDYVACRAEWCPLVPLPEKMDSQTQITVIGGRNAGRTKQLIAGAHVNGWNACLDAICSKVKEE